MARQGLMSDDVRHWLLSGDPAIRWQAERDLLDKPAAAWRATRRRVATEGWGAALLANRANDGRWGGGWYSPKWISTFYTVQLLVRLGVEPDHRALRDSGLLLLDQGVPDGATPPTSGAFSDTCVIGMLLTTAGGLDLLDDPRAKRLVEKLMASRMEDGGWNCQLRPHGGPTHASLHTTLSVLEGLTAWHAHEGTPEVLAAIESGEEFLLAHRLFRSHRTGVVIRPEFTRFSFPTWWFYDVLRALEHLARRGAAWDDRMMDAVELLDKRQDRDGHWPVQNRHAGREWLQMEQTGQPSRWNTLRALVVTRWLNRVRP